MVSKKLAQFWEKLLAALTRKGRSINEQGQSAIEQESDPLLLQRTIQQLQEQIQQLNIQITSLEEANEQLKIDYAEAVSRLAKSNRDPTSVYSVGETLQSVELEREYRHFIEQDVANLLRKILRYLRETVSGSEEIFKTYDLRNKMQSIVAHEILLKENKAIKEIALSITEQIGLAFYIPNLSFSAELSSSLEDMIQRGQILVEKISRSGGELVSYKETQFDQDHHELISGSSTTGTIIQYTVTPAYIVRLVHMQEVPYEKVLEKAKVVTGGSF